MKWTRVWVTIGFFAFSSCVPTEREGIEAEPRTAARQQNPASTATAAEPSLQMPVGNVVVGPERKVPVIVEGTKLARLRLVPLRVADLEQAAAFAGSHPSGADAFARLPKSLRARIKVEPLAETGSTAKEIDLFALAKSELVLGLLEAPGANGRAAIFQRGELSILLKTGGEAGLVWVTATRTGKPVAGAEVVIQQGGSTRHRALTDRHGIARLPAEKRLRIPHLPMAEHADFHKPLVAIARSGKHVAVASEQWTTGIEAWQFRLPEIYYTGQDAIRGTVTAERGMYRPGDSVHLLGVLRQRLKNGKLAPPLGAAKVRVTDPDGNEVFSDDVALSQYGTFRSKLSIGRTARLGRYTIVAEKGTSEIRAGFEVGEYRPVRFEVTLPSKQLDRAEKIELPVSARYLYGAPVSGGKLRWTVSARPKRELGKWTDGYTFTDTETSSELLEVATGEATLDAAGKAAISVPSASISYPDQALDLIAEATVEDAAGDSVSGQGVQSLVRAPALIGIKSDAWVVSPKQGWTVNLMVAGADGAHRAGHKLKVDLVRKKWVAVAEQHGGSARYEGDWQDEVVATRKLSSPGKPFNVHFDLPAGGQYRVQASLEGEQAVVSETIWAYGSDAYGAWDNHARMQLHADKTDYRPGERAKLYAEVPYEKAWALVTLEREGVLDARALELKGSGTPIEVPLGEQQAPNVFASVAVVPQALAKDAPAAGPPLRIGYKELTVSAEERRLRVEVTPNSTRARPGDGVDVRVRVSDAKGRPARGEVTLWAADEGVLKLTGYATPDPFVAAYERHSHQVRTSASLLRYLSGVSDEWDEYGGDDGPGDDAGAAFRSRFLGTAFFSKGVVTNARGEAQVKVPLPDNLTRWRVMAVVADSGARFGSGQAAIETAKPLQIEPALPRFLTRGDKLDATVMVHNQTSKKGTAEVKLSVSGAELEGASSQKLELAAGEQAPVRFALRATKAGSVRVKGSAELGSERDGFQLDLPVHSPTLWQTELAGDGRLDQPRKVEVALPANAEPGLAELVVSVAPGVLASIGGGVDALMEYPHGCVEQTTSRLIPMVLLEELLRASGDSRVASGEHRKKMEQAVAHVLKHQNGDGGFGLWPSTESEGFLTAYALWGLFTAKDGGYSVPAGSIRRGLAYLEKHTGDGEDMHGQFAPTETRPFSAFVLALAKHGDGSLGTKLAQKPDELTHFGTGLLGAAFLERDQKADQLLAKLASAKKKTGLGALIEDKSAASGLFEYGSDLRATAATVRALALSGNSKDADELVAGILGERRKDGSWGTTYNNLWALHAIVDYGRHGNPGASSGRVKLSIDKTPLQTLEVSPKSRLKTLRVGAGVLPQPGQRANLTLDGPKGSSLRYTARLRWASTVSSQKPVDRGFAVKRELLDATTGKAVTKPSVGQLLRVRLTITTAEDRDQVALIDRLPAGFEAVDTALKTSQQDPNAKASSGSDAWVWRELHDERVTHFADSLPAGTHHAEYLVRATRSGTFLRPAASAEAMYAPDIFGHGAVETVSVQR